jgi:methionyl-tRNA synthetase
MANAPLTRDTDFSWDDFQRRINDELADVVGNFLHRTFTFTNRFYQGQVPEAFQMDNYDQEMVDKIKKLPIVVGEYIENFKFREGLVEIIKLAKQGNKYFNDKEPWKTVKSDPEIASTSLYICNQLCKTLAIVLNPYLPVKSLEIIAVLNIEEKLEWDSANSFIPSGHKILPAEPIFSKIEDKVIRMQKETLYQNQKEVDTVKEIISIEDFAKIDLRVGNIIGAEKVKDSDNLLKLIVDVKDKKLQVVAGLAKNYSPEDILNQKVIILVNLKPAKLFGIKSEGMILATKDTLNVLSAEGAAVGEKIK